MNDRYAGVGSTAPKVDPRYAGPRVDLVGCGAAVNAALDKSPPPPPTRGFIGDLADGNDNILIRLNALNERALIISERLFGAVPESKGAEGGQAMAPCGLSWLSQQQVYMHAQLHRLGETLDRLDRL